MKKTFLYFVKIKFVQVVFSLLLVCSVFTARSQDSLSRGTVTYTKDPRIEILGEKMSEFNEAIANSIARSAKGYRLMLISTSDRNEALALRTRLIQLFPDQKVYMLFQSPYIKLKFGNYLDRNDAEKMKKHLNESKIVTGNIYVLPETIEVKPEKPVTEE